MQYASGILLPPVQTLVATLIFAKGENAKNPSPSSLRSCRQLKRTGQRGIRAVKRKFQQDEQFDLLESTNYMILILPMICRLKLSNSSAGIQNS